MKYEIKNTNQQAWDPHCPDDAELVEFTPELQKITLDAHNKLRNQLAMGETPRYPPAARMATMVHLSRGFHLLFLLYNRYKTKQVHFKILFRHGTTNWLSWPNTTRCNVKWITMSAIAHTFSGWPVKIWRNMAVIRMMFLWPISVQNFGLLKTLIIR